MFSRRKSHEPCVCWIEICPLIVLDHLVDGEGGICKRKKKSAVALEATNTIVIGKNRRRDSHIDVNTHTSEKSEG